MRLWLDNDGFNRDAIVFIAWEFAYIIGWCYINEGYDNAWQISCYVHPKHRHKGIGTKFVLKAKKYCKKNNKKLTFDTSANYLGYNMYKRIGLEYQEHLL